MDKPVVRSKIAHGQDELVRLGSIELPPGSKAEYRDLDGWWLKIWVKNGGTSSYPVSIKGLILFPEDENGWAGITASSAGQEFQGVWHIGTNRYGRSYAQTFDSTDTTLLGYADVTGALGLAAGDNDFVILTGRHNSDGDLIIDLTQTYQLGYQAVPRNHFEVTEQALV
jgi:hypothetical protein